MKHIAMRIALVVVALGAVVSTPGSARADQSGDPDFCYGGWAWLPDLVVSIRKDAHRNSEFFVETVEQWVCQSD